MKLVRENETVVASVELDTKKNPTPEYIERLSQALRSEQAALTEYQAILEQPSLPAAIRDVVTEIMEDEKDHMVLLASALETEIVAAFPNNTSELEEKQPVTEAWEREKSTLSVAIEKISVDSLSEKATYKIETELWIDDESPESAEYEAREVLADMSETSGEEFSLASIEGNSLTILCKTAETVDIPKAKNIITEFVTKCDMFGFSVTEEEAM